MVEKTKNTAADSSLTTLVQTQGKIAVLLNIRVENVF